VAVDEQLLEREVAVRSLGAVFGIDVDEADFVDVEIVHVADAGHAKLPVGRLERRVP
jgi:hypothetical protein